MQRSNEFVDRGAITLVSGMTRRQAVGFEVTVQPIGGEVGASDGHPDSRPAAKQVDLWVEKNGATRFEAKDRRPGHEQMFHGLCRGDTVRETNMDRRGTSSLNEIAQRAKETACSAASCKGYADLERRVVPRADLLSEDVSQCLRLSAWAERLIEESSSQGCD